MNLAHLYEPKDDPLVDPLGSVPKGESSPAGSSARQSARPCLPAPRARDPAPRLAPPRAPAGFPKWTVSWWGPITTPSFEFMTAVGERSLGPGAEQNALQGDAKHQLWPDASVQHLARCTRCPPLACTSPAPPTTK